MNTCDWFLEHVEDTRVVLVEGRTRRTYGELKAAVLAIASKLQDCGLESGDRVGILGPNSLFWVASYLAVLKLGLVAVPFSLMLTPADAKRNAQFASCKTILMDRRQRRSFASAFTSEISILHDDILEDDKLGNLSGSFPGGNGSSFDTRADAALMFTSGTTAAPKAVRITHGNIQANTESIIEYLGLNKDDCMLVILPFFYCFGTSLLHTHLRSGACLVLCNNFTFPEVALDLMERECCTGFAGVPSSFQLLLRISTFKSRNLPALRLIQQAGGKLHGVLVEELVASKPSAKVYVMYGQTEATARLSYLPPADLPDKLGSVGKGIPGVTLRVTGEDGAPVAPGQVGEIRARGLNISPGYLDNPEATAEKFKDGELCTGDLATVDEDGYIYVVDRKDDFIKSWGYRISSQEIESGVLCLTDVVSAAAVGVDDPEAGEAINVFITVKPGSSLTPEIVLEHCRGRFAKYMVPSVIRVIPSLPLNSNGKVLKSELRKMALV